VKGVDRAEKTGVDESAGEIECRHQDEETDLPAAEEIGRETAAEGAGVRDHRSDWLRLERRMAAGGRALPHMMRTVEQT
jgi:hypothetical protein